MKKVCFESALGWSPNNWAFGATKLFHDNWLIQFGPLGCIEVWW